MLSECELRAGRLPKSLPALRCDLTPMRDYVGGVLR